MSVQESTYSSTKVNLDSGVWNTSDNVALTIVSALGAIALIGGILAILATQGYVLGPINAISTLFPIPAITLITGLGGALVLTTAAIITIKILKNRSVKKELLKTFNDELQEKIKKEDLTPKDSFNYNIDILKIDSNKHIFSIITNEDVYLYKDAHTLISQVKKLEDNGFTSVDQTPSIDPSFKCPLPEETYKGHPRMYMLGVVVTLISIPAFIIPFFCPFPYAWTVQTAALGVLTAVTYGIANDQVALRQSKTYFTLGHTQFHKRLLKTEDPTVNGVVWGIHATWILGAIAGIVMALTATVTYSCAINPLYLLPLTMTGSLGAACYSHIKSKNVEEAHKHPTLRKYVFSCFNNLQIKPYDENYYDTVHLDNVPEEERAGWLAVGERNGTGYKIMPALGGVLLVAIVVARVTLALL